MNSDYARMWAAVGQGYAAGLAATAEVGTRAMRASAAESGLLAAAAARALRAPDTHRMAAVEDVLQCAFDAQARQLHNLRGISVLWNMTFLRYLDAARQRQEDF